MRGSKNCRRSSAASKRNSKGSFLDSMRDAVLGRREPPGSVPSVRSPATQTSPMPPPPYGGQPGYPPEMPTGPAFGSGGSFLGTAASTAAGVIGGGLLLNSIRSMFGQHVGLGGQERSALGSSGGSGYRDMAEKRDRTRPRPRPRTKTKTKNRIRTIRIRTIWTKIRTKTRTTRSRNEAFVASRASLVQASARCSGEGGNGGLDRRVPRCPDYERCSS